MKNKGSTRKSGNKDGRRYGSTPGAPGMSPSSGRRGRPFHAFDLKGLWEVYRLKSEKKRKKRKKAAYFRKKLREERIREVKQGMRKLAGFATGPGAKRRREKQIRRKIRGDILRHRKRLILGSPSRVAGWMGTLARSTRRRANALYETGLRPYFTVFREKKAKGIRRELGLTALNSTVIFIVAFWIMFFVRELVSITAASFFSIPSVLHPDGTTWPLSTYSTRYTPGNIILIFGSGPLFALSLVIPLLIAFRRLPDRHASLRLLVLWMVFHGLNQFFGGYLAGLMTHSGMKYVTAWIFNSEAVVPEELFISLFSVAALLTAGYMARPYFMSVRSVSKLKGRHVRFYYLLALVVIPCLAGSLVILATCLPGPAPAFLLLQGSGVFMGVAVLFSRNRPGTPHRKKNRQQEEMEVAWLFILIFALLSLVIRIYIFPGIQFS